jgi:hypothetical protein
MQSGLQNHAFIDPLADDGPDDGAGSATRGMQGLGL